MKTINFDGNLPVPLKTMNKAYSKPNPLNLTTLAHELRKKAKKMIFFLNYKPDDENLGGKAKDNTLNAEDEEKKMKLKIEKYVQKSISNLDVRMGQKCHFSIFEKIARFFNRNIQSVA